MSAGAFVRQQSRFRGRPRAAPRQPLPRRQRDHRGRRLLPTLLRFDAVYNTHFRRNGRRLIEYPNLIRYTTDLFSQPRVAQTFALDEIKARCCTTRDELNPKRIIPAGPLDLGFTA